MFASVGRHSKYLKSYVEFAAEAYNRNGYHSCLLGCREYFQILNTLRYGTSKL